MKKTLIALAAVAATGVAFAQSSVTLSGNVGMGVYKKTITGGTEKARVGLTDGAVTFAASEDLGGGMSVNVSQTLAVSGHDNAAKADGGSMEIKGGFGSLKSGAACAGRSLGEAEVGGNYSFAHALGNGAGDCVPNWRYTLYTLPTFVEGLTVAARISSTPSTSAIDPSVQGFSAAENGAQLRFAYATGGLNVAYYARSTTGELHASYKFGDVTAKLGIDTKTSNGLNKRTEIGVSAPMGPVTVMVGYGKQKDTNIKGTQLGVQYALSKRTAVDFTYGSFSGNTGDNVTNAYRLRLQHSF